MTNIPNHRELTNYEAWQLEKYGNVEPLLTNVQGELELNEDELRRLEEWMELQAQLQEVPNV